MKGVIVMVPAMIFILFMGIMAFVTVGFIKAMDLILTVVEWIKNRF